MSNSPKVNLSISNLLITEPFMVNIAAKAAEAKVAQFAEKWGIKLPQFDAYNTVFAFLFPDTTLERLVVVGNLNCLLFYIDDMAARDNLTTLNATHSESLAPVVAQPFESVELLVEVFRVGKLPPEPTNLQLAFSELRQQFLELSDYNEVWLLRLAASLERYFTKTNRPATLLGDICSFDLQAYVDWREDDSGMYTCIDTIEFTQNLYLPPEILQHPTLHKMQRDCVEIVALMNDVFSFYKEVYLENYHYNLINIIMQQQHLSLEEAVKVAIKFINQIISDFYQNLENLPHWEEPVKGMVDHYVQGLRYQIGTAWHWQLLTERYRSADSPFSELRAS